MATAPTTPAVGYVPPPAANGGTSVPPTATGSFSGVPAGATPGSDGFISPIVQPYATVNVKSHIPVTLTMKSTAYSRWASYFKSLCGKFGLRSHIDGTMPPRPQDPAWDQADCCVRSWFFGSVDDSVLDLAMTDDNQTARDLWLAIEGLFRANRQSRAIFLSHDFHSMTQGDSTIAEYCGRMKTLADALRDVGHPVQDSQLVLNLLRGLTPASPPQPTTSPTPSPASRPSTRHETC